MKRHRLVLLLAGLTVPACIYACGGDDVVVVQPPADAGHDATASDGSNPADGSSADGNMPVDGSMPVDANKPADARADSPAPVDAAHDTNPPVDAGVDSPTAVDSGTDSPTAVDSGTDSPLPVDAGFDVGLPDVGLPDVSVFDANGTDGAVACNNLPQTAQQISLTAGTGTFPTGTGGTVQPGLYHLTAALEYGTDGAVPSATLQETLLLQPGSAAGTFNAEDVTNANGNGDVWANAVDVTATATSTWSSTNTCPNAFSASGTYTFDTGGSVPTLHVYLSEASSDLEFVYEKQ
jgi:hypothetical protein